MRNMSVMWIYFFKVLKPLNEVTLFADVERIQFTNCGQASKLTWGSYRGDRIGIFHYNVVNNQDYGDVDFFKYNHSRGISH